MNRLSAEHQAFFDELWTQYQAITPQAIAIHQLFESKGEIVENDHVAFRTFADSPIGIHQLEPILTNLGFRVFDDYHFEAKKLYARSYVHALLDTKIFLSELKWHELSYSSQHIITGLLADLDENQHYQFTDGRLWLLPSLSQYQTLAEESEYAAWMSVWGLRANHFTIFVNRLQQYNQLQGVIDLLLEHDYLLNEQGGVIKGTPDVGLIQSSTLADKVDVQFSDGETRAIPSCYYEFAQRFDVDGELYQGFVTSSADKIFESTHSAN